MVIEVFEQMDFNDIVKTAKEHEDKNILAFLQHVKEDSKEDDFMKFIDLEYPHITKQGLITILSKDELYIRSQIWMD